MKNKKKYNITKRNNYKKQKTIKRKYKKQKTNKRKYKKQKTNKRKYKKQKTNNYKIKNKTHTYLGGMMQTYNHPIPPVSAARVGGSFIVEGADFVSIAVNCHGDNRGTIAGDREKDDNLSKVMDTKLKRVIYSGRSNWVIPFNEVVDSLLVQIIMNFLTNHDSGGDDAANLTELFELCPNPDTTTNVAMQAKQKIHTDLAIIDQPYKLLFKHIMTNLNDKEKRNAYIEHLNTATGRIDADGPDSLDMNGGSAERLNKKLDDMRKEMEIFDSGEWWDIHSNDDEAPGNKRRKMPAPPADPTKGVSDWVANSLSRVIGFCSRFVNCNPIEHCKPDTVEPGTTPHALTETCPSPKGIGAHFGFTRKIVENILSLLKHRGAPSTIDEGDMEGIKTIVEKLTKLAMSHSCVNAAPEEDSAAAKKASVDAAAAAKKAPAKARVDAAAAAKKASVDAAAAAAEFLADIFEKRQNSLRVFHMPESGNPSEKHFGLYIYCSNSLETKNCNGDYIDADSFRTWLSIHGCIRDGGGDFTLYDVENYLKANTLKGLGDGGVDLNTFIETRSIIFDVCCRPLSCQSIENENIELKS